MLCLFPPAFISIVPDLENHSSTKAFMDHVLGVRYYLGCLRLVCELKQNNKQTKRLVGLASKGRRMGGSRRVSGIECCDALRSKIKHGREGGWSQAENISLDAEMGLCKRRSKILNNHPE